MDRQTQDIRKRLSDKMAALKKAKSDLDAKLGALKLKSAMLKEEIRRMKQQTLPELNTKVRPELRCQTRVRSL